MLHPEAVGRSSPWQRQAHAVGNREATGVAQAAPPQRPLARQYGCRAAGAGPWQPAAQGAGAHPTVASNPSWV